MVIGQAIGSEGDVTSAGTPAFMVIDPDDAKLAVERDEKWYAYQFMPYLTHTFAATTTAAASNDPALALLFSSKTPILSIIAHYIPVPVRQRLFWIGYLLSIIDETKYKRDESEPALDRMYSLWDGAADWRSSAVAANTNPDRSVLIREYAHDPHQISPVHSPLASMNPGDPVIFAASAELAASDELMMHRRRGPRELVRQYNTTNAEEGLVRLEPIIQTDLLEAKELHPELVLHESRWGQMKPSFDRDSRWLSEFLPTHYDLRPRRKQPKPATHAALRKTKHKMSSRGVVHPPLSPKPATKQSFTTSFDDRQSEQAIPQPISFESLMSHLDLELSSERYIIPDLKYQLIKMISDHNDFDCRDANDDGGGGDGGDDDRWEDDGGDDGAMTHPVGWYIISMSDGARYFIARVLPPERLPATTTVSAAAGTGSGGGSSHTPPPPPPPPYLGRLHWVVRIEETRVMNFGQSD